MCTRIIVSERAPAATSVPPTQSSRICALVKPARLSEPTSNKFIALVGLSGRLSTPANASVLFRDPLIRPSPSQPMADRATIPSESEVIARMARLCLRGEDMAKAYLGDTV